MKSCVPICLACAALAAPPTTAQGFSGLKPHGGEPATISHRPRGALGTGTSTLAYVPAENRYEFTYDDGSLTRYAIDMDDFVVKKGLIRIVETELTGGATLVKEGGLRWRAGGVLTPSQLQAMPTSTTRLIHESWDATIAKLTLGYADTVDGVKAHKRYEFQLVGKCLRIRMTADSAINNNYQNNYAGPLMGPTEGTDNPLEQHIPYMDSIPVVGFDTSNGGSYFMSSFVDMYRSNGGRIDRFGPTAVGDSFEFFFGPTYFRNDQFELLKPIDETINLIVSEDVEDLFPIVDYPQSPYYATLSDDLLVTAGFSGVNAWRKYKRHWEKLAGWGVLDLAGYMFAWEQFGLNIMSPLSDQANVLACNPADIEVDMSVEINNPAYDATNPAFGPEKLYFVDSTTPANMTLVAAEFGGMMQAADDEGYTIAIYQDAGAMDQQGQPGAVYQGSQQAYDVSVPLYINPLIEPISGKGLGMLVPSSTGLAYQPNWVVRTPANGYKFGWDTTGNLEETSWDGEGHATHVVSPSFLESYWTDAFTNVIAGYQPRAAYVDATTTVRQDRHIDQIDGAPRSHTIWRATHRTRKALKELKRLANGPLFGENSHSREHQWESFESGLWDGRHRSFGTDLFVQGMPSENNADSWVIPDYELREVLPVASAHHGMGWEYHHFAVKPTGDSEPYDGDTGDVHSFFDSVWATELTYGHTAFTSTNGHHKNNFRSMEGILREYYLITPVQRAMRESKVDTIEYSVDPMPSNPSSPEVYVTLSEAIHSNLDLKNPRMKITYQSGLVFYANHEAGGTDWAVTLATPNQTFYLPPNAWVASDGQGLVAFSGKTSANGPRFDYVNDPGRWEMISRRGTTATPLPTFNSFPDAALENALSAYSDDTIIRNHVIGAEIGAEGGLWDYAGNTWDSGTGLGVVVGSSTPPSSTGLQLAAPQGTQITLGNKIGLLATLELGTVGSVPVTRDVTRRATWTVSGNPGDASVDTSGAFSSQELGQFTVSASFDGQTSTSVVIDVVDGDPQASIEPISAITMGDSLVLDARQSTDPDGLTLGYEWDFGDGSPDQAGPLVHNTYHEPGTYTATVRLTDRDGNQTTATKQVTVNASLNALWADEFNDATISGWAFDTDNSEWGIRHGRAQRSDVGSAESLIVVDRTETLPEVECDARMIRSSGSVMQIIGAHLRGSDPTSTPRHSGYLAGYTANGKVKILEAATGMTMVQLASANLPTGFNPDVSHTIVADIENIATGPGVVITVTVDSTTVSVIDTTPQSGSYVGITLEGVSGSFDDFVLSPSTNQQGL